MISIRGFSIEKIWFTALNCCTASKFSIISTQTLWRCSFSTFVPATGVSFLLFPWCQDFFSDSFNLLPKSWRGENWLKSRGIPLAVSGIVEAEQNAHISFSSLGLQWLSGECIVLSLSLHVVRQIYGIRKKKRRQNKNRKIEKAGRGCWCQLLV